VKPVNVNEVNAPQQTHAQRTQPVKPKDAEPGQSSQTSTVSNSSDHISMSNRAAEVRRLVAKVGGLPDVRQPRVDSVRQRIQSGQYQVSSVKIADAIIRDQG
jgi:negative regulator of flagellin synthesis FlgM